MSIISVINSLTVQSKCLLYIITFLFLFISCNQGKKEFVRDELLQQNQNKKTARYLIEEVIGKGQHDKYQELHTSDFILHSGKDSFSAKQDFEMSVAIRKDFPDLSVKVEKIIAEDDWVTVYWHSSLSQKKEKGYFPTVGITLFRFRNGKVCEEWNGDCPHLK